MKVINYDENARQLTAPSLNQWLVYVKAFLVDRDVKETSETTYASSLKQFLAYLQMERLDLLQLGKIHIQAWREYLASTPGNMDGGKGLLPTTINIYLVVGSTFMDFLVKRELIKLNPFNGVKLLKMSVAHLKDPLNATQATELLNSIDTGTIKGSRDYAMISLFLRTGIRSIEASRILLSDIGERQGKPVIWLLRKGRDSKDKFIVISPKAKQDIDKYLLFRENVTGKKPRKGEPLFTNLARGREGAAVSTRGIRGLVKAYLRGIGIDDHKYSCHSLRHTAACSSMKAGSDMNEVQRMLDHASDKTTKRYLAKFYDDLRLSSPAEYRIDNQY